MKRQNVFQQLSPTSLPHSSNLEGPETERSAGPDPLVPNVDFPAVYFLDLNVSRQYQVDIPKASFPIPGYVSTLIGDISSWRETATLFFNTTHEWMPIVSKKRFYEHLNPLTPLPPDYALLILSMGLMAWLPGYEVDNPRTAAYMAAKRFYLDLEIAGVLSIQALQAGIFISLFEMGHAVYPSAFLSAAACARYGSGLGLDWRTGSPWKRPFLWVDAEERNRVWWAVVLLDWYILSFSWCLQKLNYGFYIL